MKIGVAGMGRMGATMAQRLVKLGHDVSVWNRDARKTVPVAAAGARVAASARALAEGCDVILTCVADAAAIDAVYNGPEGLLSGNVGGKLFVEMSTVRPGNQRDLEIRVKAKGASLVDCPVGGSTGPARDGKLIGFLGGSDADAARAMPVLKELCRRVEHMGPVGAGTSMKLTINLPLMVYWQVLGEALSICKPLGVDPARLIDIIADTSAGPNVLKSRGPLVAAALGGKLPADVTFNIDLSRKDLRNMIDEARSLGADAPVTELALRCYDEASRAGFGEADVSAVPMRWVGQPKLAG